MSQSDAIENLFEEHRAFAPAAEFTAQAVAQASIYEQAAQDRLGFWAEQANKLHWHKPFTKTLNWSEAPFAKWFEDGEINVAYNCLDRHVLEGRGDRVAIHFEGEPGDSKTYTYAQLTEAVKRAANVLTNLGVAKGDRVELRGFGAFSVKARDARIGRNPRTGEAVQVEDKKVPFFKTGKLLRDRLNGK